ncbi:hypothetical protein C8F04DRAFT_1191262 [Mycena alexandri]|uniref:Uncharacterized protein n=1 Tax=Mycena alexandri TaxID=1745969 RepID=A0AAD6SES2_9AGAR|nr:hypothetical protein C8F04DRAFT_1191262 [Mycena alexandri]
MSNKPASSGRRRRFGGSPVPADNLNVILPPSAKRKETPSQESDPERAPSGHKKRRRQEDGMGSLVVDSTASGVSNNSFINPERMSEPPSPTPGRSSLLYSSDSSRRGVSSPPSSSYSNIHPDLRPPAPQKSRSSTSFLVPVGYSAPSASTATTSSASSTSVFPQQSRKEKLTQKSALQNLVDSLSVRLDKMERSAAQSAKHLSELPELYDRVHDLGVYTRTVGVGLNQSHHQHA